MSGKQPKKNVLAITILVSTSRSVEEYEKEFAKRMEPVFPDDDWHITIETPPPEYEEEVRKDLEAGIKSGKMYDHEMHGFVPIQGSGGKNNLN